jgi:hypothetical protein
MKLIRRRRRVIAQLDGPSPRLVDVANLKRKFATATINLHGYCKIQRATSFPFTQNGFDDESLTAERYARPCLRLWLQCLTRSR